MNANALKPVLIIGGSGVVGAQGLYTPDLLIDPAYQLQRLREFGVQVRRAPDPAAAAA